MCDRCDEDGVDPSNPWVEIAMHGLTREDQIDVCKEWIAVRQARLDQMVERWERQWDTTPSHVNRWRLEEKDVAQFRIEFDRWQLEQFEMSFAQDS